MKNKKVVFMVIAMIICVIAVIVVTKFLEKEENQTPTEITPGEEMTEEQERQTMISLYYINTETNTLMPEARVIDVKKLLENPYKSLIEYLIEAPKNEKLKSSIPENTKINNIFLSGNVVTLDLSKELIEGQDAENIKLSIQAIVATLTELNEVEAVKIIIDGEENKKVEGTDITFSENFTRNII